MLVNKRGKRFVDEALGPVDVHYDHISRAIGEQPDGIAYVVFDGLIEWEAIYREAWSLYYSPAHLNTLMRRAVATGVPLGSLLKVLVTFATTVRLESVHPLQGGIVRLKTPSERRPGLPREVPFVFWASFGWITVIKYTIIVFTIVRLLFIALMIMSNRRARAYLDQALTPVGEDDHDTHDLLTKTTGGREAVAHAKKVAMLTGSVG